MKTIVAKINGLPDKVIIAIAAIGGLLLSGLLLVFIAWPSFNSIGQVNTEIETESSKLSVISESIAALSKEDKERLENLVTFLAQLVPEKVDMLHFATLNELVSDAAGVTVSNIQISMGAAKTTTASPAAATTVTESAQTNTTAPTPAPATPASAVSVAVTYSSNFDSLLSLIKYWSLADQLVGIKEINISGVADGRLTYTINYELPVAPATAKATVEDKLNLTEAQKKQLEDLQIKIIYTATPSANAVGKSNPFN